MPTAELARSWALRVQIATDLRDALICTMRDEGATYRKIADAVGLTPQGVSKIVHRKALDDTDAKS